MVGTPVEQGKLLFQIAPLDAYRVILQVDERDIAYVQLDQKGELTLSGLPDRRLAFTVQQITPVASQEEGRNFFRVEAHLANPLHPWYAPAWKASARSRSATKN